MNVYIHLYNAKELGRVYFGKKGSKQKSCEISLMDLKLNSPEAPLQELLIRKVS